MKLPAFLAAIALLSNLALAAEVKPLRALLITGGCCHDYGKQKDILKKGIEERANVVVDQVHSDDTSTKARFEMYEKAGWAKGYDVVIHDECAAEIKDMPYAQNIVDAHKNGVSAVNLHCAMHSYRTGTDLWFEYLGLQSSGHGPQKPIALDFTAASHPITQGMANWTTTNEELYNNVKVFGSAKPLVMGSQDQGKGKTAGAVVAWTNDYHGTRVFSTTLAHNNSTVADERYLNLVVRGLLWTCDKLNPAYLKPYAGPAGKFETIPAKGAAAPANTTPAPGAQGDDSKKK